MENREPEKSNPNHRKVFYFLNILFMCMITAASLAMTVILFVRLERLRSEKQVEGSIYTDSQIEKIRYGAAQAERNRLLLEIQSSFESGNSTISMLRNLFPGDLVVMWEGRYYFYPVDRNLQTNPFSETDFAQGENGGMDYIGENAGVSVNRGVDVSALNGEIDWAKVAEEQIAFAMIRAAVRNTDGELAQDERFQENMSGAKSVGLRIGCYVDLDADSEKAAEEIADFVLSNLSMSQQEMGAPVAVRVQIPDHTSSLSGQTREEWTQGVRAFCAKIKKAGYEPVIYANTAAFHMLLNMAELEEYDKWIADYGDYLYFPYKFKCWQYSLKGTVNGIEGDVALDLSVSTE
jgi:GH25 family lysozyme M1 (1,4-beta-N-acetylmuramidase)